MSVANEYQLHVAYCSYQGFTTWNGAKIEGTHCKYSLRFWSYGSPSENIILRFQICHGWLLQSFEARG